MNYTFFHYQMMIVVNVAISQTDEYKKCILYNFQHDLIMVYVIFRTKIMLLCVMRLPAVGLNNENTHKERVIILHSTEH